MRRKVPIERRCVENIIAFVGNENDPLKYIRTGRGLSLNDSYWITEEHDPAKWPDCNLYTTSFEEHIAHLVFANKKVSQKENNLLGMVKKIFGIGHNNQDLLPSGHISSPEFTTNGMLRKCWDKKPDRTIYLRKAEEPDRIDSDDRRSVIAMEYYAAQAAEAMGLNHVPYELSHYHHEDGREEIVCECPLFTSDNIGYVPACHFLKERNIELYKSDFSKEENHVYLAKLYGYEQYADMMIFDSVILNSDRHFWNFGLLVDNNTGEYLAPAPLFDNGSSEFIFQRHNLNKDSFVNYLADYSYELSGKFLNFDAQARLFVEERHIPMLESLKNFELKQPDDPSLGIADNAVEAISAGIRFRSRQILEMLEEKRKEQNNHFYIGFEL